MRNDAEPAEVFSLAEFLGDEMLARGWTTDDVAALSADDPNDIAEEALVIGLLLSVPTGPRISEAIARRLSRAFDVSWQYFMNLDVGWHRWPDKRSPYDAPDALFGPIVRYGLDNARHGKTTQ